MPVLTDRDDVRSGRARATLSKDAGRAARYAFFERARALAGADAVALGHTRDDQAETFLLRLTRGAGPRGLGGMYPRNGDIVRPVLACRRADLVQWLSARARPFIEDETNRDVSIPRNRVRAELLPLLEARFNPAIVDVLADEAELAREAWQWLDAAAKELAARLVRPRAAQGPTGATRWTCRLVALPLALRRAVLWRRCDVAGLRPISFGHVDAASV